MEGSASPSCPQRHGCSTAAMTLKPAASAPRSSPPGSGEERDRYTTVRSNTRDDATDAEVLEVVTLPAQVKHGRRQRVMLCSGEPGIGKSSLLRRFVHAAGRRRTAFSRPTALVRMMAVNSQPMGVDLLQHRVILRDRGHAQIARVFPAGGDPVQLTFNERVNWFPHLSPDGGYATYLS